MAGGMRRRDNLSSLSHRVNAGRQPEPSPPRQDAPSHQASPPRRDAGADVPVAKPCWVTDRHGHLPGLLLEWRRVATGFQGRVVHLVQDESGWIVVVEWLPAEVLQPG